jgi:iron complex transport system ATP-binding protein
VTEPAIFGEALTVRYGRTTVLHGVSIRAAFGEVTAIVGPNASGKTTALKALAGLLPLSAGCVLCGGVDASTLSRAERARRVAYVPQRSELDAAQTVTEVVAQGRYPHHGVGAPSRADRDAVARALEEAAIAPLGARRFTELSGGEQRRVLIARALATEATTMLLDEPTASLDVAHVIGTHDLLAGLAANGRAIVVVLHALDDVRTRTNRAYLLDGGRVVEEGASADVVEAAAVRRVYDVDLVEAGALGFRRTEPGS